MAADTLMDFSNLQRVLEDFAKDIRENYTEHLMQSDRKASGDLINSIKTQVVVGDSAWEVTMTLKDYWKYIEWDTKPHFPPVKAILKWVQIKPVIPRPGANGKIPSQQQLAYMIARKISKVGTKGSHDMEITKENILPWYKRRLADALGRDASTYIRKVIKTEL